jgi:3-oxoacyl-[acyl-carrier-protein] synthase III
MSVRPRVVTNHDLARMMETSNERIIERTGIEFAGTQPDQADFPLFMMVDYVRVWQKQ